MTGYPEVALLLTTIGERSLLEAGDAAVGAVRGAASFEFTSTTTHLVDPGGVVVPVRRDAQEPARAQDAEELRGERGLVGDVHTDVHDERLARLEAKRVWWPAGLALLALGVASGNLITILYILSRVVP